MKKYKYNYENATEKRESQEKHGRLDIPHDTPDNHPQHLKNTKCFKKYNTKHCTERSKKYKNYYSNGRNINEKILDNY